MTDTKTCDKCAYWAASGTEGHCHRHAPVSVTFKVDDRTEFASQFPVTKADDWCGDFEAK
ncbi:MAG: hypothetical protein AAGK14_00650 [Verrucomicrobiota bacterium]